MNTKTSLLLSVFILLTLSLVAMAADEKEQKEKEEKVPVRESSTFGIYPPMIDLECPPGQSVSTTIKVDNPNKLTAAFEMIPVGLITTAKGLASRPVSSLPPDHLSRHVRFETPQIVVPGRSHKNVTVTLDVPPTLAGTHYAGLTVANASPTAFEQPGASRSSEYETTLGLGMQPAIGITIKCHIQGTERFSYALTSITVTPSRGNQPSSAKAEVKNTGNAEIPLVANLILLDSSNKVMVRMKGERMISISPGATKEVEFQPVYRELPPGKYKAILSATGSTISLPPLERSVTVTQ